MVNLSRTVIILALASAFVHLAAFGLLVLIGWLLWRAVG